MNNQDKKSPALADILGKKIFEKLEKSKGIHNLSKAILNATQEKDGYTATHCDITGVFADPIAKKVEEKYGKSLGLSKRFLFLAHYSAIWHDIGKIGIPIKILNKKEGLDDNEWSLMKKHPLIGKMILESIGQGRIDSKLNNYLDQLKNVIYLHHERCDGSGYPNGLTGDQIPIESSIIAIADSFHAMISDRPYRKAYPFDDAVIKLYDERKVFSEIPFKCFISVLPDIFDIYKKQKTNPKQYSFGL